MKVCPIQEICEQYDNKQEEKDHFMRLMCPCNEFLAMSCDMGVQLQMFITGAPIACSIDKIQKMKEKFS